MQLCRSFGRLLSSIKVRQGRHLSESSVMSHDVALSREYLHSGMQLTGAKTEKDATDNHCHLPIGDYQFY